MTPTKRIARRLSEERGEAALISGLLLLAGVLIPLMFIVPLYARIELAQVDAQQAARDAVRSAVQAPNGTAARTAATAAVAREASGSRTPLSLTLTGTYARGEVMSARVSTSVPIGALPFLGHFGTVTVHGEARAPVDRYRSILTPGAP
jgi:type II secretory pathway component PulM